MHQIFITCTQNDAEGAKQMCTNLKRKGYSIWHNAPDGDQTPHASRQKVEIGILGSIGVIAVWSINAQQSERVKQNLLFAQQLRKRILLVAFDKKIKPPKELTYAPFIVSSSAHADLDRLLQHLPSVESPDPMDQLYEQVAVACERDGVSSEHIQDAAKLVLAEKYRDEALALLEYLAQESTREEIREEAQEILANRVHSLEQPQHFFIGECTAKGPDKIHFTLFDKRIVCASNSKLYRKHGSAPKGNPGIDCLILHCGTCGAEMSILVDCEGYQ